MISLVIASGILLAPAPNGVPDVTADVWYESHRPGENWCTPPNGIYSLVICEDGNVVSAVPKNSDRQGGWAR